MHRLTTTLAAVQRLIEPCEDIGDDSSDELDQIRALEEREHRAEREPSISLQLIDVKSTSAAYQVSSSNAEYVIDTLTKAGRSIESPDKSDWTTQTLSALADLSHIASTMDCQIEFRKPGLNRQQGQLLAIVQPNTYSSVAESAFTSGITSILGRIERVGGATEMRCGLRILNQPRRMVYCTVATPELMRDLGAHLYEDVVVTGMATWVRYNWLIRWFKIHDFELPKTGSIMDSLRRIYDAGGSAWDQVEDPAALISEMRR